jgi:hypothetical protein
MSCKDNLISPQSQILHLILLIFNKMMMSQKNFWKKNSPQRFRYVSFLRLEAAYKNKYNDTYDRLVVLR